eukprot:TRINITY_DN21162_c0_g1_i1.p1 TRINITY_DN21162_c0_g1~~TRINITY_DN21162_c0_g1_i1.p1  ORF type:complete len:104 (+),score=6.94 TRINITY_DN21162_c0_g1_i1:78-389(+)
MFSSSCGLLAFRGRKSLSKILKTATKVVRTEQEARALLGVNDDDTNPYVQFQVEKLMRYKGEVNHEFMMRVRSAWEQDANRRDDLIKSKFNDYSKFLKDVQNE